MPRSGSQHPSYGWKRLLWRQCSVRGYPLSGISFSILSGVGLSIFDTDQQLDKVTLAPVCDW